MSAAAPDAIPTEDHTELVAAATAARDRSYAPYSRFHMGAAVRCADGTIVPGALVENVSLGLAMCAERAAFFATVAQGRQPVAVALVAERTSGELTFPCGACLQVGLELGGPELTVVAADPDGASASRRLDGLLTRAPHRHTYGAG
jgi:cytidine deaminase